MVRPGFVTYTKCCMWQMLGSSVILLHKEPRLQRWGTNAWWRNWHNSIHSGILVLPKTSSSAVLLFDCIKSRARGTINSYHMGLNQGYIADRKPSAQTPWYPIPIFSEFKDDNIYSSIDFLVAAWGQIACISISTSSRW